MRGALLFNSVTRDLESI